MSTYVISRCDSRQPSLLLRFRAKTTRFRVTGDTFKTLANELNVTESQVIHMALSKLAQETFPTYEPDDEPLTSRQVAVVRKAAKAVMPKGKLLNEQSLF